jgi:hypothetical protein
VLDSAVVEENGAGWLYFVRASLCGAGDRRLGDSRRVGYSYHGSDQLSGRQATPTTGLVLGWCWAGLALALCLSALCPALPLRMAFLGSRAAGVATACWGLDYAVACTTVVIAGHGPGLMHRSGVVTRQSWYLSQELCSSVKHSPKHLQRPRQHADAGFRGGPCQGD